MSGHLAVNDHRRVYLGNRFVYPVFSRRAGGLSIGVNLNPTNNCNWRCIYCQVPNLCRGPTPPIDLKQLQNELDDVLDRVLHGSFLVERLPPSYRRLQDVAFSGNGEPTLSHQFGDAVKRVGEVLHSHGLLGNIKVVLISNGSMVHTARVQGALSCLKALHGEMWFKLDGATKTTTRRINGVSPAPSRVIERLCITSRLCRTWVQTCLFALDGKAPTRNETDAYARLLADALARGAQLEGVLLYGPARPSRRTEASRISRLTSAQFHEFAEYLKPLCLPIRISE